MKGDDTPSIPFAIEAALLQPELQGRVELLQGCFRVGRPLQAIVLESPPELLPTIGGHSLSPQSHGLNSKTHSCVISVISVLSSYSRNGAGHQTSQALHRVDFAPPVDSCSALSLRLPCSNVSARPISAADL
jgi:hypothetical protein